MSVVEPGSSSSNLVERVKNILTKPAETWDVIDAEPATIGGIYKGYVAILSAIPAVIGLVVAFVFTSAIGSMLGGLAGGVAGGLVSVVWAVVNYALGLLWVYVFALIIDALAPTFGGTRDRLKAFKVSAYTGTAVWVGCLALLVPVLGGLVVLAALIYSLYICYLGLPKLMKTPEEKALPYLGALIGIGFVIGLVLALVMSPLHRLGMMGVAHRTPDTIVVPGGKATIDLGKLQDATQKMDAAAQQMKDGKGVKPTDPDILKDLLPADVAGYGRSDVSTSSGGAAGISGSNVEATYTRGDGHFTLAITDLGSAGALAGLAGSFNVNSSHESDGKYEKVSKVDGRMTTESFDKSTGHGEYGILVGDRFLVQAEGDKVDMASLKTAVSSVEAARLEGLAKG